MDLSASLQDLKLAVQQRLGIMVEQQRMIILGKSFCYSSKKLRDADTPVLPSHTVHANANQCLGWTQFSENMSQAFGYEILRFAWLLEKLKAHLLCPSMTPIHTLHCSEEGFSSQDNCNILIEGVIIA